MKGYIRAISYFLSLLALATIFFGIEFIIEKFFFSNDEVVDIIAAIAGAFSFTPLRTFFDRMTDRIFFRGPRDIHAEFIANVSHELQTPIAILRGNVEVLQRKSTNEHERAAAERVIVNTLDGMSRVITNVLEGAKLTFSKKIANRQEIDLKDLLKETCEDFSLLAEEKGVGLKTDFLSERADAFLIYADPGKLKEVLLNLISNALKHTPHNGSIALSARRDEGGVRIVVEDSGCGIAPDVLPHIFERFYKIQNPVSAFADGGAIHAAAVPSTGIGLNICQQIIQAHGGRIAAESQVGKGSRFTIHLPISPP